MKVILLQDIKSLGKKATSSRLPKVMAATICCRANWLKRLTPLI